MFERRGIAFGGLWVSDGNRKLQVQRMTNWGCEPQVGGAGEQYRVR